MLFPLEKLNFAGAVGCLVEEDVFGFVRPAALELKGVISVRHVDPVRGIKFAQRDRAGQQMACITEGQRNGDYLFKIYGELYQIVNMLGEGLRCTRNC